MRAERKRQQSVDSIYGTTITQLRAAVVAVHRQLSTEPDRAGWHPRARLARTTLGLARSAEPGGLYALATQAVADLDLVPSEQLDGALPEALDRLRRAVERAAPASDRRATDDDGENLSRSDASSG
ncbi:hypothetical protein [Plantactinospora veratri]